MNDNNSGRETNVMSFNKTKYLFSFLALIVIEVNFLFFTYINKYTYLGAYYFLHGAFIPNPVKMGAIGYIVLCILFDLAFLIGIKVAKKYLPQKGLCSSILCAVLLLCTIISFIPLGSIYNKQSRIIALQRKIDYEKTVIHACGSLIGEDGVEYTYVNCLEALNNSLKNNNHFVEVDFDWTSDNKLVCYHYLNEDITEKDFLATKDYGQFTRMSLDTLADVMKQNPDLYVVTDIKGENVEGCRYIADRYPELQKQFIIQVYHDDEFEPVYKLGFEYIILTLYGTYPEEREIPSLRKNYTEHDYLGITFWDSWTKGRPNFFEGIGIEELNEMYEDAFYRSVCEIGMPVYVHTVNDKATIIEEIGLGVSAFYTDNTDNEWLRK
ncbi:hypothetical protein [Butyrivibrio proteoclasticus]|uniref:hypothetical protein n=1 Tax=Butyrivibrio proteoclasticus TaxID=43305 RepID=UPI00047A59C1|nr:hypothetical protein [Butyrivibrio proteoclasticus]